jgi:uncharacterized radical SAM superfamily Fe-S cluster-containing enzyme
VSLTIDAVDVCNLRCPSCPSGRRSGGSPVGLLAPRTLQDIVEKARTECHLSYVSLFNWGEPLLHPELPRLVSVVREFGVAHFAWVANPMPVRTVRDCIDDVEHSQHLRDTEDLLPLFPTLAPRLARSARHDYCELHEDIITVDSVGAGAIVLCGLRW